MLENFTIEGLLEAYRDNKISKQEVFESYLDRIQEHNSKFNVYVNFDKDIALENFKNTKFEDGQVLSAIPYGLKDNFLIKDNICTAGSKLLEGFKSPIDAEVVKRLKNAGAVSLGMLNTDEFTCGCSS